MIGLSVMSNFFPVKVVNFDVLTLISIKDMFCEKKKMLKVRNLEQLHLHNRKKVTTYFLFNEGFPRPMLPTKCSSLRSGCFVGKIGLRNPW